MSKGKFFAVGVLALVMVFGLVLAGCNSDDNDDIDSAAWKQITSKCKGDGVCDENSSLGNLIDCSLETVDPTTYISSCNSIETGSEKCNC